MNRTSLTALPGRKSFGRFGACQDIDNGAAFLFTRSDDLDHGYSTYRVSAAGLREPDTVRILNLVPEVREVLQSPESVFGEEEGVITSSEKRKAL